MKNNNPPILMYLLLTLFIGLKLTGHIDWHWLLVVSPLWVYWLGTFAIGVAIGFATGLARRRRYRESRFSKGEGREKS